VTEPSVSPKETKDRSTLLFAFGIVEVVLGLFCLLMAAVSGLGVAAGPSGATAPDPRMMVPGILFYGLLAVYYITTGIGTMRLRRWARPIVLIVSWFWLVSGVFAMAMVSTFLPKMMEQMPTPPGTTSEVMAFAQGCTFFFFAVFYLILPGIFVSVYGSSSVRATFERRDPVARWTDRCPTPVLGLSFLLAYAALGMLFGATMPALPVFGFAVGGAASTVLCLGLAGLLAFLTLATYRLRPWAWWTVLFFWLLGAASAVSFVVRGFDWQQFYGQMGLPADQIAMIEKMGVFNFLKTPEFLGLVGFFIAGSLAFLLWVRKHFRRTVS
jgi:hypothetical protein